MENGGGARALGMGGAFTAVADDPSATFWNPAGLSGVDASRAAADARGALRRPRRPRLRGLRAPVNWSLLGGENAGVGISVIRLGVDDIPFTDHLRGQLDDNGDGIVDDEELLGLFELQDQIRFKSDQEFGLLLSYGEQKGAWRFGGTLKFIRQSVGTYSSLGIGADLALLRPGIWRRLDFGLKLQDVTTTYLSWNTGHNEVITPAVVPGLAWRQPAAALEHGPDCWPASLETRFEDRGEADQFVGGSTQRQRPPRAWSWASRSRSSCAAGFDSGFDAGHLTAGAGFRLDPLTIDYAYAGDTLDIDEVTHRISLSVRF